MGLLNAIKKTIAYANSFDSRIDSQEIYQRLISKKIYKKTEVKKMTTLLGIVDLENKIKEEKIKKAEKLTKILKNKFKDILLVGISGSVAAGHPKEDDDIDIVIITKSNKLWINRFRLRCYIFFKKIPHRKYGQKENKDEFCFNLWLDENGLLLPKDRQKIRSAVDLIALRPLLNRKKIYERFILENNWAKEYLATGYNQITSNIKHPTQKQDSGNIVNKLINRLFYWSQYRYMRKKITSEKVSYHQAIFFK